jgi:hypothetical protein
MAIGALAAAMVAQIESLGSRDAMESRIYTSKPERGRRGAAFRTLGEGFESLRDLKQRRETSEASSRAE